VLFLCSAGKYCDEEKTIQLKESRLEAESTCVDVYETGNI
jgi:hypothetical protein